ncbi:MFS transporter [Rothia uropygialis]|uniref:hypothetical protein n=1 Tax=Kocuria sp. 36 TaxID=1415402 RepID=UPI00101C2F87|nr:hypothetical protein [Kocuria sp. 36]
MSSTRDATNGPEGEYEAPTYGIRIPESEWTGSMLSSTDEQSEPRGLQSLRARATAYRRMAGGLSFASCMLGILMIFGLVAASHPRWAFVGIAPLSVGIAGLVSVRWRLAPAFRDQEGRKPTRYVSRWFWAPVIMVVLSAAFFVVSYMVPRWMEGSDTVLVRNHVVMWSELGFLFLLLASLSAGLIALGLWSTPDHDDAILRETDYAERRRAKDSGQSRDLYDSDWIKGNG